MSGEIRFIAHDIFRKHVYISSTYYVTMNIGIIVKFGVGIPWKNCNI